jgi:phosphoribosyl 1,2-cyclic phosphodiesterase
MSLKICVLGSGSSGNCTFISSTTTALLVDAGISALRIEKCLKALNQQPDNLAVLITHSHHDHISGIETLCRRHPSIEVYCHQSCFSSVRKKLASAINIIAVEGDFFVGDITVSPFKVSHDVPCVGYSFLSGGSRITLATDTGKLNNKMIEALSDSDLVVLESNHDEALAKQNPNYSAFLKSRILSDCGHLSNAACAECVARIASCRVKQVVLAHLSKENNYPELAFETCKNRLLEENIVEGRDVMLEVAQADKMSSLFEIE